MVLANRLAVAGYLWAASIWAMPAGGRPWRECNAAPQAVFKSHLPGHPFEALGSHGGCWLFVSLQLGRDRGGIAVLDRMAGTLTQTRIALLSGPLPAGLVLTHDGALLIFPDGSHVYFLDTDL